MPDYDAIVIGAGQAGPPLAARLSGAGRRVALVERHRFGGTCVNVGCIPTKTLVASARVAHVARRAADFGVRVEHAPSIDMRAVKARKDAVVRQSAEGVEAWLRGLEGCTVYEGHARFAGPRTIVVGDETLRAEQVFINAGARARIPDFARRVGPACLNNSSMMDVDFLPEHLVVVGGSYIGLEFAQMYRRFGSHVTVIERGPRLVGREDEDVSVAVQEILESEGITVRVGAECLELERRERGLSARIECATGDPEVVGSHALIAVGRVPNTHDLGLEDAGVDVDERGFIVVDDRLATSAPGVWALGECNGRGAFTHTSYNDFEIAAANLLDGGDRKVTDRITAYALYIDPPLGRAGLTEREVRDSGVRALVATRPMSRVGRAVERGETRGFMKVLVDAGTLRVLGASILGIGGDEVVHSLLDVMYADAPYTVVRRAVHIHPTVTELIPTLLGDLAPLS